MQILETSYIKALKTAHFEECPVQSPELEPGYEKVVVLSYGKHFRRVAVISGQNLWKSKLGDFEDIEHPPVKRKMGKYGTIHKYLRRDAKYAGEALPEEYRL